MPLKTLVKVGSITNLSDARYCAGMGVEMLGFRVIAGQERFLGPKEFQEIRGWVTGPKVIAEVFGIQAAGDLSAIIESYKPDYLELGVTELRLFDSLPLPFILSVHQQDSVDGLKLRPAYLLIQDQKAADARIPCILEVSSPHDVEQALHIPGVQGIAMHGSPEIRPGLKEYNVLADILELLDAD